MLEGLFESILIPISVRVLVAILVWMIGRWFAKRSRGWLGRSLQKSGLTESFITLAQALSY